MRFAKTFLLTLFMSIHFAQAQTEQPYQYQVLLSPKEYAQLPETIKYEYIMAVYKALIELSGETPDQQARHLLQYLLNELISVGHAALPTVAGREVYCVNNRQVCWTVNNGVAQITQPLPSDLVNTYRRQGGVPVPSSIVSTVGSPVLTGSQPVRTAAAAARQPTATRPLPAEDKKKELDGVNCINGGFAKAKTNGRCLAEACEDGSGQAQCFPRGSGICVPKSQTVTIACGQAMDEACQDLKSPKCQKLLAAFKTVQADQHEMEKLDKLFGEVCKSNFTQDGVANLEANRMAQLSDALKKRAEKIKAGGALAEESDKELLALDTKWEEDQKKEAAARKLIEDNRPVTAAAGARKPPKASAAQPAPGNYGLADKRLATCIEKPDSPECKQPGTVRPLPAAAQTGPGPRPPVTRKAASDKPKLPGDVSKTCKPLAMNIMQLRKYSQASERATASRPVGQ